MQPTQVETDGKLAAGTTLKDIYQIDAPLAKGGMGELYRGHTIESGDPVAIKLVRTDLGNNEAALALFRKEASALSRLNHQAIVRYYVFSFEPSIKRHFMAMELVEGASLSELLRRGPLNSVDVNLLCVRLASGLQAAHEQGIIHRDVSPDNVIIQDGKISHARIIDFGIARSTAADHATVIGAGFAGKHNYVSPEQVGLFGGNVTEKSDIYSLGLVLVQCLRGRAIDMGGTWFEIVEKRRHLPDLSDLDPQMRSLLQRMLEPDPSQRLATMTEVATWPVFAAREQTLVAPARPPSVQPQPRAKFRPLRWVVAPLMAICVVAAAAQLFWLPLWQRLAGKSGSGAGDVTEAVAQYVRNYAGGNCFLALPIKVTEGAADINGYGDNVVPFNDFNEAFKKAFRWEPKIYFRKLASIAQCPTLAFVSRLPPDTNMQPKIQISKPYLKNGESLEGSLRTHSPYVELLIVDDDGNVYGASEYLKPEADGQTFSIGRLQVSSPEKSKQILLVGVTSVAPISALKITGAKPSTEVFASALTQARQLTQPANATMVVIKLN